MSKKKRTTKRASNPDIPEPADTASDLEAPPSIDDDEGHSLTEVVMQAAMAGCTLVHDTNGRALALVQSPGGQRDVYQVRSHSFEVWLSYLAHDVVGRPVGPGVVGTVRATMEGIAIHQGSLVAVHARVATIDDAVYVDLGDVARSIVKVTKDGWEIVKDAPVVFTRNKAMRALPMPERGGNLSALRPICNLDDQSFVLFACWLVTVLRGRGPFTHLVINAAQGTAKTTLTTIAKRLTDPNAVPLRSAPRDERTLAVAAAHNWLITIENVRRSSAWLSDLLCRMATGGARGERALFTDDRELVLDVMRPAIINGIEDFAHAPDLLARCIFLHPPRITDACRRPLSAINAELEASAGRILGVLLDGVAAALAHEDVDVPERSRMADFEATASAAEQALGFAAGSFRAAYDANRRSAARDTVENDALAQTIVALVDEVGEWFGSPTDLLTDLSERSAVKGREWPAAPNALSARLRRLTQLLADVGVAVELDLHEGSGNGRARRILLRSTKSSANKTSSDE